MSEKLVTWPEPAENQEAEKSIIEEAREKAKELKSDLISWKRWVKDRGRKRWESLMGTNLPHNENGHTIDPLPSEVPPVEPDEVIPSSYGNLPIDTIPEKPVSLGTPEQQEIKEPEKVQETPQNPAPAQRIITAAVPIKQVQWPKLPRYIGPRPQTEEKEKSTLPPFHEVQAWETLHGIAAKYKINLPFLSGINGIIDPSKIQEGEKIFLNKESKINADKEKKEVSPLPPIHEVKAWENLTSISTQYGGRVSVADLRKFNNLREDSTLQIGQIIALKDWVDIEKAKKMKLHFVRSWENLTMIAKEHGVTIEHIMSLNNLSWTEIQKWQKLVIQPWFSKEKILARGLTEKEHFALILDACDNLDVTDPGQIAYILATAEHESGYFSTRYNLVEKENRKSWPGFINYDTRADLWNTGPGDGMLFKWRGYVQLTGRANYTKYDLILKQKGLITSEQSIITNPNLVLEPKIAAFILVHGMINGEFTGKKLWDYILGEKQHWLSARRTVNKLDRAAHIANMAQERLQNPIQFD